MIFCSTVYLCEKGIIKVFVCNVNCSHLSLDEHQSIPFHHLISKGQQLFELLFLEGMTVIAGVPSQFQRILQIRSVFFASTLLANQKLINKYRHVGCCSILTRKSPMQYKGILTIILCDFCNVRYI